MNTCCDIDELMGQYLCLSKQSYIKFSEFIGPHNACMIATYYGLHSKECNRFIKQMITQIQQFYSTEYKTFRVPLTTKQSSALVAAVRDHIDRHRKHTTKQTVSTASPKPAIKTTNTVEIYGLIRL